MSSPRTSRISRMSQSNLPSAGPKTSGRSWLVLGILVAISGIVIYTIQMQAKDLSSPWYVPVLATVGAAVIVYSLVLSRTIIRWISAGLFTLLAGFIWFIFLVGLAAPPYTGPVTVGRAFPSFETKLAGGQTFSQADLAGEQNTVLLFFRGLW